MKKVLSPFLIFLLLSLQSLADEKMKDMSDPLAVYTQAGIGITNKGFNLKFGQAYDSGQANIAKQNIFEIKGIGGDIFGWDDDASNAIDSIRLRNFSVDLSSGRGTQLDISYNLHAEVGSISYSLLQALPKIGNINIYPLTGIGLSIANNAIEDDGSIDSGYSIPGTFAVIGMYGKYTINDKIWINYNPIWSTTLSGSDNYKNHAFINKSHLLSHEFALSYQINKRSNIRYFANWNKKVDFKDGDHRIEYNYQF